MIVLISGRQGSGKTTLARNLVAHFEAARPTYHLKFADPLYAMHEALRPIAEEYGIPFAAKEGALLQFLGTEWGRKKDPQIWVRALVHRVERIQELEVETPAIIIDDCRFVNELEAFPQAVKIRLSALEIARQKRTQGWRENTNHQSEIDLDQVPLDAWDLVVDTTFKSKAETFAEALAAIDRRGFPR